MSLESFESSMVRCGAGHAPNGADYRIIGEEGRGWNCERVVNGCREVIVGFNGAEFGTIDNARRWAVADGRLAEPGSGKPYSQREVLI